MPSTRRNPVLADIFGRLGYMERQGSGLNKIREAYENAANYEDGMEPVFYSDRVIGHEKGIFTVRDETRAMA